MSREKANLKLKKILSESTPQKNHKKSFLRLLCLFCIFLTLVIIFLLFGKMNLNSENRVLTSETAYEYITKLSEEGDSTEAFTVTMSSVWNFKKANKISPDAYVENSTKNNCDFYFTVSLPSNEDTILYTSDKLSPGNYINNIKLTNSLSKGSYKATLTYYLYNQDGDYINKIPMEITINILN